MRLATVLKVVAVLVVALAVTAVAVLMSTDFGAYKGRIEAAVQQATGRRLAIDGKLSLRLGLTPALTAENVRFANADWGSQPDMAKIDEISAEVRLVPLILGRVEIKRLVIDGADILLETDKRGRGNWMFASAMSKPAAALQPGAPPAPQPAAQGDAAGGTLILPSFDRVHIKRARLVWRDGRSNGRDEITINSLDAQADDAESPVRIALHGLYTGVPLVLDGTFGPLADLDHPSAPWPVDLIAKAGGGAFRAKGTIRDPLRGKGVDMTLSARGDDLSDLAPLTGLPLPAGPYRLDARVEEKGAVWTIRNLTATLGNSSLAGEVTVDTAAKPLRLRATLAAPLLDTADLAVKPAGGANGVKEPAGAVTAKPDDGRIFSDAALPVDDLKGINARLELHANRVVAGGIPLTDVTTTVRVEDGVLTADPLKATAAGAPIAATLSIGRAPGKAVPALAVKLDAASIDLATLLKQAGEPNMATGKIDLSAEVTGAGKSVRALMAGLNGQAEIAMGRGTIADATLDLLSADVLKAITPWAPRRHDLQVRCLIGRYDIRHGMLTSRATVFDSDRVALSGDGGVNLATEQIGFTVVPYAKDVSLLQLAVPIRIGGTLAAPVAFPDAGRIASGAVHSVTGLPGTVAGAIGNLLGDSPDNTGNRCLAALDKGAKAGGSGKPLGSIGRTIEGIGKGIGSGLKTLLGK